MCRVHSSQQNSGALNALILSPREDSAAIAPIHTADRLLPVGRWAERRQVGGPMSSGVPMEKQRSPVSSVGAGHSSKWSESWKLGMAEPLFIDSCKINREAPPRCLTDP